MATVGVETLVVEQFIHSTLALDATIVGLVGDKIFEGEAAQGIEPPLIIFGYQGASDVRGVGTTRIMTNASYIIRGVVKGDSFVPARPIAARIDALFHNGSGTTEDGAVLASWREEPFSMTEVDRGILYKHLGGIYRFLSQ